MKRIFIMVCCLFVNSGFASDFKFDIYGVDHKSKVDIIRDCSTSISEYVQYSSALGVVPKKFTEKQMDDFKKRRDKAMLCINKKNTFIYTEISPTTYFNPLEIYTTIDIVRKEDSYRIPNKSRNIDLNLVVNEDLKSVFSQWNEYAQLNLRKLSNNTFSYKNKSCPVDHCIWGFSSDEKKHFLSYFINSSNKYSNELKWIIAKSKDDILRANAVFILAHSNQSFDNAKFLSDFINDKSNSVRNNVMRVLSSIYKKHKSIPVSTAQLCKALNYPDTTDRNKAAMSLLSIAQGNPKEGKKIIKLCGNTLIDLLKLKQPNNHNPAYQILKEISGKNYKETGYSSWASWTNKEKS